MAFPPARHDKRTPREPILRAFKNIECRDAVLAFDAVKEVTWEMARANPGLPGLPDEVCEQLCVPVGRVRRPGDNLL